jgi:hypothetical protein
LNEPRPHYMRFWLDPTDQTWHPLHFAEVPAVAGDYPLTPF